LRHILKHVQGLRNVWVQLLQSALGKHKRSTSAGFHHSFLLLFLGTWSADPTIKWKASSFRQTKSLLGPTKSVLQHALTRSSTHTMENLPREYFVFSAGGSAGRWDDFSFHVWLDTVLPESQSTYRRVCATP
jgi:hypothetical protein